MTASSEILAAAWHVAAVRAGPGLLLSCLLVLAGCASTPPVADGLNAPVEFRTLPGASEVRDGRGAFRAVFCEALRADGLAAAEVSACDRWLWRLRDEPGAEPRQVAPSQNPDRLTIFLVTGAFSECVGNQSRPFAAGAARLLASGASVSTIVVGGRSGTGHNARQIADMLASAPTTDERRVILVGYSKGGLDILRFLVDYPQLAERVDAVVGVATPVFGTPLADLAGPAYRSLLAEIPREACPPGDGEVIDSLRPEVAAEWLVTNPLPSGMRLYSLAAFATRERVARVLVPFWERLGATEARNDGQVVAADAVIPGSTLLGFANSDHWGIALTTETVHPVLLARPDPAPFPLEQLFTAIVTFVARDLERDAGSGLGALPIRALPDPR